MESGRAEDPACTPDIAECLYLYCDVHFLEYLQNVNMIIIPQSYTWKLVGTSTKTCPGPHN